MAETGEREDVMTTLTPPLPPEVGQRSEEGRVGEEGRSRGAPDHLKKKKKKIERRVTDGERTRRWRTSIKAQHMRELDCRTFNHSIRYVLQPGLYQTGSELQTRSHQTN